MITIKLIISISICKNQHHNYAVKKVLFGHILSNIINYLKFLWFKSKGFQCHPEKKLETWNKYKSFSTGIFILMKYVKLQQTSQIKLQKVMTLVNV